MEGKPASWRPRRDKGAPLVQRLAGSIEEFWIKDQEKNRFPSQRQLGRRNSYWDQGEEGQLFCPPQAFKSTHLAVLSCFSCVHLFVTLWTVDHHALLSMGFSRQEYWVGLPCPPPGDLPNPGIDPESPALQVDSLPLGDQGSPTPTLGKAIYFTQSVFKC